MKRSIALIVFVAISISVFADRYVARHEDIETFLKTTTHVVLENNPMSEYNIKIREAVERSWKITPYVFISANEFEEMRNDISKSFLVLLQVKFSKDKLEATYNFMSVVLGSGVKRHTDLPDICSIPLGYNSVPEESYSYKLESFIRFAQNHIRMLNDNPGLIKGDIFKHYNKFNKEVQNKELWVLEKDLDKGVRSLTELRKAYRHTIRIVTDEDVEKAIAEKNNNVVFLHKVGPEGTRLQARCYKMLIGAGDDKMYFFDYHMINTKKKDDGLRAKDLKKIGK